MGAIETRCLRLPVWIVVGGLAVGHTLWAGPVPNAGLDAARSGVDPVSGDNDGGTRTGPATRPHGIDLTPAFDRLGLMPRTQGSRSTCSLFAITALANYEWLRSGAKPDARFSEEFLVWAADEATGLSGDQAMFYEAIGGLNGLGICCDELMPYAAKEEAGRKPSGEAIRDAAARARRWQANWIRRWDMSRPVDELQFAAIQQALIDGRPVACGLRWPKSNRSAALVAPPPPEEVYDGHSIVLVGFEDDPAQPGGGVFRFRNSRGPRWGDRGYGVMSYAYVRSYANDAVWITMGPTECERPLERFEAEEMDIIASRHCEPRPQSMEQWKSKMWSGGRQLYCRASDGGFVELAFTVKREDRYRLRLLATAAPDYGQVRVSVDGEPTETLFDLYCGRVSPAGSLELGTRELRAGRHVVRVSAAGKSAASSGYAFGLDCVDVLRPLK